MNKLETPIKGSNYEIMLADVEAQADEFVALHMDPEYYGCSTVAAICGVGYDSPMDVWLRRTGKKLPVKQNAQMALGKHLEPFVHQQFNEIVEKEVGDEALLVNQVWQNKERPWMIASPDAILIEPELLESKLIEYKTGRLWASRYWDEDRASDAAMCQLQWYLAVSGLAGGWCVGMFGGDAEEIYRPYFESSSDVQSQLIEQVEAFRELVKSDVPPGAGPGDAKLIREHLAAELREEEIELDDAKHHEMVAEYLEVKDELKTANAEMKLLKERIKTIENQFLIDANGANVVRVGESLVRIKEVERGEYTVKATSYITVNVK